MPSLVADLAAITALSSVTALWHKEGAVSDLFDPVVALVGVGLVLAAF